MFRDCSRSFLDFYISKLYAAFDQISIDMKLNSSHLTSSVQRLTAEVELEERLTAEVELEERLTAEVELEERLTAGGVGDC